MEGLPPLKPLLAREDLPPLSESYARLSSFLANGDAIPTDVAALPRDLDTGRLRYLPAGSGRPLSILELLIVLKNVELRGMTREISRRNVALASGLGATALRRLHERTEGIAFTFELSKGIAAATGSMHRNIEHALHDAIGSVFVRDLVQETGQFIYSRRHGLPDQKKGQRSLKKHKRR